MSTPLQKRLQRWGFSWQGLLDNRHGEWWVIAQMGLIAAHALPPEPSPAGMGWPWPMAIRISGGVVVLIGLAIGAQATFNLGDSLSPLPEPIPGAALVTEGAYSRCRHPIYQCVLLCSLGVVLLLGSLLHLGLMLCLAVVLAWKARREEQRLCDSHPGYGAYRERTAAIVPRLPGLDWRN